MFQKPPASTPAQETTRKDSLLIHHLSDIHYGRISGGQSALEVYADYLAFPNVRQPDLLLITGDITLTGARDEMREAAAEIRNITRRPSAGAHRQRVFLVPGPHDIDWSNPDSFESFRDEFHSFMLPSFYGRQGDPLTKAAPYVQSTADNYFIYLINTCIVPETLSKDAFKRYEELLKQYTKVWRDFAKAHVRPGGTYDENTRRLFLEETRPFVDRDPGLVQRADIGRFAQHLQSLRLEDPSLSQPGEEVTPLKILMTHHPLIAYSGRDGHPYRAAADSGALLQQVRHYGFHLAFHGHTHQPHILSDMPLDPNNAGYEMPLLQVGAGSLGSTVQGGSSFNEILATRDREAGGWTADIRIKRLGDEAERPPLRFALFNPGMNVTAKPSASTSMALVGTNNPSAEIWSEFERRLRIAIEDFTTDLLGHILDLPVRPLKIIEGLIKEVIFANYTTRVGLALKQPASGASTYTSMPGSIPQPTTLYVLQNKYIDPGPQYDAQYIHPFTYPDTLAAWALILGEPMIYPLHDPATPINNLALEASGKLQDIANQLLALSQQRSLQSPRDYDLYNKLMSNQMVLGDTYLPSPADVPPSRFTSFIAMPLPLRPTAAIPQQLPEIGVLHVDVIDPSPPLIGSAFTLERVDMLKTLSYVIAQILLTADVLERPKGTWH